MARGRRSRPAVRVVLVATTFAVLAVLTASGTPGTPRDEDGLLPAAAAPAAAVSTLTPTPAAAVDPLVAGTPAPRAAPQQPDPLAAAAARARRITDSTREWASFTLADRKAGRLVGDTRTDEVTNSESVVKAWLAADLLATAAARKRPLTGYERERMVGMIRVSDDNAAEVIWRRLGGDASIRKMIRTCRLTDTRVYPGWWSLTQISSRDMVRLGACLTPGRGKLLGRAASKQLLDLMRTVAPSNAFGIQQAQPAGKGVRVAVKNGWTEHGGTGLWNVNCLALWGPDQRWVLAVTTRYPIARGLDYGAGVCRRVTAALFP
ncbi:MAG TPA: serine hydrolase [Mycobacteriales bacterium]|nr:serine hydrolase [Mycobacteriales bacterium]